MKKYKLQVGLRMGGGPGSDLESFVESLANNLLSRKAIFDVTVKVDLKHAYAPQRPTASAQVSLVVPAMSPFTAPGVGFMNLYDAIVECGGVPKDWESATSMFPPGSVKEVGPRKAGDAKPTVATVENFAVQPVAA